MEDVDIHLCRGYILVGRRGRLTEGAARVCAVPWGEGGGGEMATWGREKDNKYVNYIGTFDRRQWGQRRRGTTTGGQVVTISFVSGGGGKDCA